MAPPRFPQELFDAILDHLHDDPATLRNCALICHAWLPTSRLHLFSRIHLRVLPRSTSTDTLCRRLYHLLSASPALIPHIHELSIISSESPNNCSSDSLLLPIEPSWVFTEETLPGLLQMLTHLRKFEFTSQATMPLPWESLPDLLRRAIESVFHLPTLSYVRLCSWSFPHLSDFTALLGQSPNLRGLALWSTQLGSDPASKDEGEDDDDAEEEEGEEEEQAEDKEELLFTHPTLEFLTLDYVDFNGGWFAKNNLNHQGVDLTRLRELRIAHSDDQSIDRFLHTLGSSLEHFHLKPGPMGLQPIDLTQNTSLRSLRLTLESSTDALSWASTLLLTLPSPHLLERLAIEVFIDPRKLSPEGWDTLDNSVLSRLPALSRVDIGIWASPAHAEFLRVVEELRGVRERGVLRVYQLGSRSCQRLCGGLTPLISRFEGLVG